MNSYDLRAFRYAIIVALGGFIFGLDAALISGTVRFITNEFSLSDWQVGFAVSAPAFGVIFALLVTPSICFNLGRKKALIIIASLYFVSAVTSVLAFDFWSLSAARALGGFAFTSLSVAAMYIGEVAPAHMRGKLVSSNQINIVIGLSAAYFANYFILQASGSDASWVQSIGLDTHTWRWMLGVEIIPAGVWLALLFTIPESPRWLMLKGRAEEAEAVMRQIMAPDVAKKEAAEIKASVGVAAEEASVWSALPRMFDSNIRKAMLIGLIVAIAQPLTGINAIMFYAPTVFEQVGMGTDQAFMQSVITGLVSVVFTIVAIALIDRAGRKPLLLVGLGWAVVSHLMCAYGFATATYTLDAQALVTLADSIDVSALQALVGVEYTSDIDFKNAMIAVLGESVVRANDNILLQAATHINATLVLLGIMGFIAAFHISIGPIMWVLFSEIFPTSVRGVAIPVFGLLVSVVNFFVQQLFPWQLSNLGVAEIFMFYAVPPAIAGILIYIMLPETKNRSIEEIEAELTGKTS